MAFIPKISMPTRVARQYDQGNYKIVALIDSSTIDETATLIDILAIENPWFARVDCSSFYAATPVEDVSTASFKFPGASYDLTNGNSTTEQIDGYCILESGDATGHWDVDSIAADTITATGHGLEDNDIVFFTSTDTTPTGITAATGYYVISSATNTFQISATSGGSAIAIGTTWLGDLRAHIADGIPLLVVDSSEFGTKTLSAGQTVIVSLNDGMKYSTVSV